METLSFICACCLCPWAISHCRNIARPVWCPNFGWHGSFYLCLLWCSECARCRVRNYLGAAITFVEECKDEELRKIMRDVVTVLKDKLKKVDYFGGYFDRSDEQYTLCDSNGFFMCAGPYNKGECQYRSVINPYASRRKRLEFSSWNFDHKWVLAVAGCGNRSTLDSCEVHCLLYWLFLDIMQYNNLCNLSIIMITLSRHTLSRNLLIMFLPLSHIYG